jgi:hypothetical protein
MVLSVSCGAPLSGRDEQIPGPISACQRALNDRAIDNYFLFCT